MLAALALPILSETMRVGCNTRTEGANGPRIHDGNAKDGIGFAR